MDAPPMIPQDALIQQQHAEEITALKAEFERVQLELSAFYHSSTRTLDTSTITPDFLEKMPTSDHFDVRVQIGSGPSQLYCSRFELVTKMLTVPDVTNAAQWWCALGKGREDLLLLPPTAPIKVDGHAYTASEYFVKVVEANPLLVEAWLHLGQLLDGKGESAAIMEENFTPRVAFDVSSRWEDLDTVLANGARTFDKEAITVRGAPYTKIDCFAKVAELKPSCLDAWIAISSCMCDETTIIIKNMTYTIKDCLVKVAENSTLYNNKWIKKCEERLKLLNETTATAHQVGLDNEARATCGYMIHVNPVIKAAWCKLGSILHSEDEDNSLDEEPVVTINNKPFIAAACFVRVLEADPLYKEAWRLLSDVLCGDDVAIVRGKPYTFEKCVVRSLEIDPLQSETWCSLGTMLLDSMLLDCILSTNNGHTSVVVGGTTYTALHCFAKAVEIDPLCTDAWFNLGNQMHAADDEKRSSEEGESIVTINEKPFTAKACFVRVLEADPLYNDVWRLLYHLLNDEDVAIISGTSYTDEQCIIKSLEIDPLQTDMWCVMGEILFSKLSLDCEDEDFDFDEEEENNTVVVSGATYTEMQCYIKAIEVDPLCAEAWYKIGNHHSSEDPISLNGKSYTSKDCFVQALEIDPRNDTYWSSLALEISVKESVTVSGICYTRKLCYERAVECNANNCNAWHMLGATLQCSGDSVTMIGDRSYTAQQCYIQSLEIDEEQGGVWRSLLGDKDVHGGGGGGMTMPVTINGVSYNRKQCCLRAIQYSSWDAEAWLHLGVEVVKSGDTHVVVHEDNDGGGETVSPGDDGTSYTPQECYIKSLNCWESGEAWRALAATLSSSPPGDTVTVADSKDQSISYTNEGCLRKAEECDKKKAIQSSSNSDADK